MMMPSRAALSLLLLVACSHARADRRTHPAAPSHSVSAQEGAIAADGPRDVEVPPNPPDDAIRTASGLAYVVLEPGHGTSHPPAGAMIRAHYVGWTANDGARFDDSYARNQPIEFEPAHVIPGWAEAVAVMVVGERIRVWIPEALAYQGKPGLPAGPLVFEIELLDFSDPAG